MRLPPGPRPKQAALYPQQTWLAETALFAAGVELLAVAPLVRSAPVAYAGGALLLGAALAGCAGTLSTWRSRWA